MLNKLKKYSYIINLIIVSAYPPIYVFIRNHQLVTIKELMTTILFIELAVFIIWGVLTIILKSPSRTSLITSLWIIYFFSFNNIKSLLVESSIIEKNNTTIIVVMLMFFLVIIYLGIQLKQKNIKHLNKFINVTILILYLFLAITLLKDTQKHSVSNTSNLSFSYTTTPEVLPDIYYIIADGHARSDILSEIFQADNSFFINFLKNKGFYIAEKSHSNYITTIQSLSSSLNMSYHEGYDPNSKNVLPLINILKNSNFKKLLDNYGYQYISFASGYTATEMKNSDMYLKASNTFSEYHVLLINMTPINFLPIKLINYLEFNTYQNYILYTLNTLPKLTTIDDPKFVFAHILSPHPPFVFNLDGPITTSEIYELNEDFMHGQGNKLEFKKNYKEQLLYLDSLLQDTITELLENTKRPTIIILQADHGSELKLNLSSMNETDLNERLSILYALYLYDQNYEDLYPNISPINTFRIISNNYFNQELKLLEDKSYYYTKTHPFDYTEVTNELKK